MTARHFCAQAFDATGALMLELPDVAQDESDLYRAFGLCMTDLRLRLAPREVGKFVVTVLEGR